MWAHDPIQNVNNQTLMYRANLFPLRDHVLNVDIVNSFLSVIKCSEIIYCTLSMVMPQIGDLSIAFLYK